MAVIVSNRSDFTTPSFKESKFNYKDTWSLYSLSDLLEKNNETSDLTPIELQPSNTEEFRRPGVSADEFIEKSAVSFIDDEAFYFPLASDKRGTNRNPLIDYNEFLDKNVPGNNNIYDVFSDETLTNALGACSTDSSISNLIEDWVFESSNNCTVESGNSIGFNIVMDQNAKKVTSISNEGSIRFTYDFTIPGNYCFSGYFRFIDTNISDRRAYIKFGFEGGIENIQPITSLLSVEENGETYYEITQDWCEIAIAATVTGPCNLVIEWPYTVAGTERFKDSSLKIAGLRLDQGSFPYPFDFRHLRAHDEKKQFPLLLDLSTVKDGFNLDNDDWTIIYGRYLRYPHNSEFTYYDCIGNIYIGLAKLLDENNQEVWGQVIYQPRHFILNENNEKEVIGKTRIQKMTYDPVLSWGYNIIEKSGHNIIFTMVDLNSCEAIEEDAEREISLTDEISEGSSFTSDFLKDGTYSVALGISPVVSEDNEDVLDFLIPKDLRPGEPLLLDTKSGDHPSVPSAYNPNYQSVVDELDSLYGKPETEPTVGTEKYWTYKWRDLIWPEPSYRGILGTMYSGRYRDLYFFPRALSEKEKRDIRNTVFALSNKNGYRSTDEVINTTLRSSNLQERSEVNIRNNERIE